MGRNSKRKAEQLPPAAVAMLKRMRASEDRVRQILANTGSSDIEKAVASKLTDAGLPLEAVQKFTAALSSKSPLYQRWERADHILREVKRLNAEGNTDGIIAKMLGIDRSYVCKLRRANGIPAVRRRP